MGMFDTVTDGDTSVQTKAFTRRLGTYSIGDMVDVITWDAHPRPVASRSGVTAAVEAIERSRGDAWIVLTRGVITAVVDSPPDGLRRIAFNGRPLPDDAPPAEPDASTDEPET
jgi:hypothetical protein